MLIIESGDLTAYTRLTKKMCWHVIGMVEWEFGEIGNPIIEDNDISFEVYRGYFEDAPALIEDRYVKLKLMDKFDE